MHRWDERNVRRFLFLFFFSFFFYPLVSSLFPGIWFLMFSNLAACSCQGHQPCFFPSMARLIWGLAMQALLTCHQQWCTLDRYTCWKVCFLILKVVLDWPLKDISSAIGLERSWNLYTVTCFKLNQHTRAISSFGVYGSHDCVAVWYGLLLLCYQHQL